jgi:hypothetical protein
LFSIGCSYKGLSPLQMFIPAIYWLGLSYVIDIVREHPFRTKACPSCYGEGRVPK